MSLDQRDLYGAQNCDQAIEAALESSHGSYLRKAVYSPLTSVGSSMKTGQRTRPMPDLVMECAHRSSQTPEEETMLTARQSDLCIARTTVPLPCFFPSVSSIKTNLMPVDYAELFDAATHPLYLISAYDVSRCLADQRRP